MLPIKFKEKGVKVAVADISKIVLEQYKLLGIDGLELDIERRFSICIYPKNLIT